MCCLFLVHSSFAPEIATDTAYQEKTKARLLTFLEAPLKGPALQYLRKMASCCFDCRL